MKILVKYYLLANNVYKMSSNIKARDWNHFLPDWTKDRPNIVFAYTISGQSNKPKHKMFGLWSIPKNSRTNQCSMDRSLGCTSFLRPDSFSTWPSHLPPSQLFVPMLVHWYRYTMYHNTQYHSSLFTIITWSWSLPILSHVLTKVIHERVDRKTLISPGETLLQGQANTAPWG